MRILINDHAGHPFQVQLSRALARRGYEVLHTYCLLVQTPRGALAKKDNDPPGLNIEGISLSKPFNRYGLVTRALQERELGKLLVKQVEQFEPEVVVSANTPLGVQSVLLRKCRNMKIRFVFWVQDLLGVGIKKNVRKKLPIFGDIVGWFYILIEELLLRKSDEVVVITEDFCPIMNKSRVFDSKVHVIYNWAPLEEVPVLPKSNLWSRKHGLDKKFCLLYSGTLGMKHNPDLLLKLAAKFKKYDDVLVVVVTEGLGADFLKEQKMRNGFDNLVLMPFQPFEDMPMVLASADILLAILEPDAGIYAVPSKVLTSLCAKRSLLLAVPPENLAARIVKNSKSGIVVPPSESEQFVDAAMKLFDDSELRSFLATNGRKYAEETFDIEKITDWFEKIIHS
ncbi:MAG: glycosyltransferase family 4 protein [Thermodesulfobacteriota bacterium]|nr:glycosyltransferase family 4 protein [Thermodesulfobacteriota bacterium]